jgi:hypothetical protein
MLSDVPPKGIVSIFDLNEWISSRLQTEKNNLNDIQTRIDQLCWIRDNSRPFERVAAIKEISKCEERIGFIEDACEVYTSKIDELLFPKSDTNENSITVFEQVLDIMSEYASIPSSVRKKVLGKKEPAKRQLTLEVADRSSGCPMHFSERSRINCTQRYRYTRRVHFRDCYSAYQGKQNHTIGQEVYDYLYKKAKSYGVTTPSKRKLYLWLKESGNKALTDHYEDINLIHHVMTGEPNDNITHLKAQLFAIHDFIDCGFDALNIPDRHNIISVWYILWVALNKLKHKCKAVDFTVLLRDTSGTRDTIKGYEDITKVIFRKHGWIFPKTATWLFWN